jgi:hypothetical protein
MNDDKLINHIKALTDNELYALILSWQTQLIDSKYCGGYLIYLQ